MPNRSRQKGDRAERAIVELLKSYGLEAYRIPLSGAVSGFKSDVEIRLGEQTLRLESKTRAAGFSRIYKWLEGNDGVVIKADRQEPLIVIGLERLARLIATRPPTDIEKATDKTSQSQAIIQPTQEPQPVTTTIDPDVVLLHDDKVYVNKYVARPVVRLPSEDDLRLRDQELEADRKRLT